MIKNIFRYFIRFTFISVFLLSVGINISMFTGGVLLAFVDKMAENIYGATRLISPAASKLSTENRILQNKVDELSKDLAKARKVRAKAAPIARKIASATAVRVGRATAAQGTNVASGWFPYAGTIVAGAFITWEIYDACVTLDYINSLENILESNVKQTICGVELKSEIGAIRLYGKSFIRVDKENIPTHILIALDNGAPQETYFREEEFGKEPEKGDFVMLSDTEGLNYAREDKWGKDTYFIEVR